MTVMPMSEPVVFEIPEALAGERVDRAVAMLTGWSRAEVQALAEQGGITVGGVEVAKSRKLARGERVEVTGAPAVPMPPGPEDVPFTVRYEDDDVIVIAKQVGLVVHPGSGHEHGTLVHGLLYRYPEIVEVGDRERPGIVHRLDRDTSGLDGGCPHAGCVRRVGRRAGRAATSNASTSRWCGVIPTIRAG